MPTNRRAKIVPKAGELNLLPIHRLNKREGWKHKAKIPDQKIGRLSAVQASWYPQQAVTSDRANNNNVMVWGCVGARRTAGDAKSSDVRLDQRCCNRSLCDDALRWLVAGGTMFNIMLTPTPHTPGQ